MTDIPTRLRQIHATHQRGFATPEDEAWDRNPTCTACQHAWPCDVAEVLTLVEAEVSHRLSPIVGWLRSAVAEHTDIDPLLDDPAALTAEQTPTPVRTSLLASAVVRLRETITFFQEPRP